MLAKEILWCIDGLPRLPITWEPATGTIYYDTDPVTVLKKSEGFRAVSPGTGIYTNPDEPGGLIVIYRDGKIQRWSSYKDGVKYYIVQGILIAYKVEKKIGTAWDISTRSLIGGFEFTYDKTKSEFFVIPDKDFDPMISYKIEMNSRSTGTLSIGGRTIALLSRCGPGLNDNTVDVTFGSYFTECVGASDIYAYNDGRNWVMCALYNGLKVVVEADFAPKRREGAVILENIEGPHLGLYIDACDNTCAGGYKGYILLDKSNAGFEPIELWWASVSDDGATPVTRVKVTL